MNKIPPAPSNRAFLTKNPRPGFILLIILSASFSFLVACSHGAQVYGVLEGHVTIGPLVPVVRVGEPEPTPNPEVYAAREVVVFKANGKTEFTRVKIDSNGNYRAELPVGTYVVDINYLGIDLAKGFPQTILITENEVTKLDIDIDTGIR